MTSLNDVYAKFGEASEAAQLLETELGTLVLVEEGRGRGWFENPDPLSASVVLNAINRSTLGNLLKRAAERGVPIDAMGELLANALNERNRLTHSFFRQHNNRRNSDAGRAVMLADLRTIHTTILTAYTELMRLSGVDLDAIVHVELPIDHLRLP